VPYALPAVYLDISSAEAQLSQDHATEAIRQGDRAYMQHSPLLLRSVEQEKQTNKINRRIVIPIVASLQPCESEQGKSTTVA
jgi:hypothetical protein